MAQPKKKKKFKKKCSSRRVVWLLDDPLDGMCPQHVKVKLLYNDDYNTCSRFILSPFLWQWLQPYDQLERKEKLRYYPVQSLPFTVQVKF